MPQKSEEKPGRIYGVHIVDAHVFFDFIDIKKKDTYLEQIQKQPPWTGTLILSNPGKDLFNTMIRYLTLINPVAQSVKYLVDGETGNIFLNDYNSPQLLKNLKIFAANSFHFLLWSREFDTHAEILVGFSRDKLVHGPYFLIICDKTTACYKQVLDDFMQLAGKTGKSGGFSVDNDRALVVQIENRLRPLLQEIFEFTGLRYPSPEETINLENLIQNFHTFWRLRIPTGLFSVLWVKNEDDIELKSGKITRGRKIIYFDLTTNELGSVNLFKDKYDLLKILQVNNIIQAPIRTVENRRFMDLADPMNVLLISGYALFRIKIRQITAIENQRIVVYQDIDTNSTRINVEIVYKDVNTIQQEEMWEIKGTGLRQNCFDVHPRFDWKGQKKSI
jgi:hypothetical protein